MAFTRISAAFRGVRDRATGALRRMPAGRLKVLAALAAGLCLVAAGIGLGERKDDEQEGQAPNVVAAPGQEEVAAEPGASQRPAAAFARLGAAAGPFGPWITSVAFTGDGKSLLSLSRDGVRVWDAATGEELRRFGFGTSVGQDISVAAFSPDCSFAAAVRPNPVGGQDQEVTVWESATGRIIWRKAVIPGSRRSTNVRFSPDGKWLAVSGWGGRIDLVNMATREVERSWDGLSHLPRGVANVRDSSRQDRVVWDTVFTPDGKRLISGGNDRVFHVWDAVSRKPLQEIGTNLDAVRYLAMSPDGTLLASLGAHIERLPGTNDPFVRVWDLRSGSELAELPPKQARAETPGPVDAFCFTPDGKTLITSGADKSLRLWDPRAGTELRSIPDAGGTCLAVSPDGTRVGVAEGGCRLQVRDLTTGKEAFPVSGHCGPVSACAVSPGGRFVVTGGADPLVIVWAAEKENGGRKINHLAGNGRGVLALALTDASDTVLSLGADGSLRARDLSGKELRRYRVPATGDPGASPRCAFSSDGRLLATVGGDNTVHLVDTANGRTVHALGKYPLYGVAFADGGRKLVGWADDWILHVWDTDSGKELRTFPAGKPVTLRQQADRRYSAAVSPDGRYVATAASDGTLVLRQLASGEEVGRCEAPAMHPAVLAFSPDGRMLAAGGGVSGSIRLFETATGRARIDLVEHEGTLESLTFSADGRRLVSGYSNTAALVWDLTGPLYGQPAAPLSQQDLEVRWADLADEDAARAYRAVRSLAARPKESVEFLAAILPPVEVADPMTLAQLVQTAVHGKPPSSGWADAELARLGEAAVPALRKALESKPAPKDEPRLRRLLIRADLGGTSSSPERLREMRALEALELAGTPGARAAMERLATGAADARRTREARAALERMNLRD